MKETPKKLFVVIFVSAMILFNPHAVFADGEVEYDPEEPETEEYEVPTYDTVVLSGLPTII